MDAGADTYMHVAAWGVRPIGHINELPEETAVAVIQGLTLLIQIILSAWKADRLLESLFS